MRGRIVQASVTAVVLAVMVAGCAPEPEPVDPMPTPTATPTVTPTPDPELVPGGTAGQNRPFFEFVLEGVLRESPQPSSRSMVDALVAAGFERAAMEVTADTTPVGQRADSILIAVQIDGQCLIGQVIDEQLVSQLESALGTGRCLVGQTLSIDW